MALLVGLAVGSVALSASVLGAAVAAVGIGAAAYGVYHVVRD